MPGAAEEPWGPELGCAARAWAARPQLEELRGAPAPETQQPLQICAAFGVPGTFLLARGQGWGNAVLPGSPRCSRLLELGGTQVPAVFAMGSAVTALLPAPLPSACSWLTRARTMYTMGSYQLRNLIRGNRHRGSHAFLNARPPHRTEQGPHPPAAQKHGQWPPDKFSSHTTHRRSRLGSPPEFSHREERADPGCPGMGTGMGTGLGTGMGTELAAGVHRCRLAQRSAECKHKLISALSEATGKRKLRNEQC